MTPLPWLIYRRVSTTEQAQGGVSLDQQESSCRAYAAARGWTVADVVTDAGESGRNMKRDGAQRVLAALTAKEVAGVIVWRLDRLTRSVRDLVHLLEILGADAGLVSVTESLDTTTPMGRFVIHQLGSVAQLESENIGERIRASMAHARGKGFWLGHRVPAGCVVVEDGPRKRLARGPQADAVAAAWPAVLAGAGLREIVERFRDQGIRLPAAACWTPVVVRNLLLSPQVTGLLVDAATQAAVRQTLAEREAPGRRGKARKAGAAAMQPSALAGLVRCPDCDLAMVQVSARGASGILYRYFRCTGRARATCAAKEIRVDTLEAEVLVKVAEALQEGGEYAMFAVSEAERARSTLEAARAERVQLSSERDQLAARIAQLTLGTQIGTTAWNLAMVALGKEVERVDRRLAEILGQEAVAQVDQVNLERVMDRQRSVAATLAQESPELQAETLQILVYKVRPMADVLDLELYAPESAGSYEGRPKYSQQQGLRTIRVRLPRVRRERVSAARRR